MSFYSFLESIESFDKCSYSIVRSLAYLPYSSPTCSLGKMFWSDVVGNTIQQANLDGTERVILLNDSVDIIGMSALLK